MMEGGMMMGPARWLVMLAVAILVMVPTWRICTRMGFPGILSLLSIVPIANLVLLYYLAFATWPWDHTSTPPPS